jgi:hypothetical protein
MLHFNEKVKWCVPEQFPITGEPIPLPSRDAWNNLRGTSKEDARGKYIKRVTHVRYSIELEPPPTPPILQLLEGIENEETKKWLGEIEAVA